MLSTIFINFYSVIKVQNYSVNVREKSKSYKTTLNNQSIFSLIKRRLNKENGRSKKKAKTLELKPPKTAK